MRLPSAARFLIPLVSITPVVQAQTPDMFTFSGSESALYRINGTTLQPTILGTVGTTLDVFEVVRTPDGGSLILADRDLDALFTVSACDAALQSVILLDYDIPNGPRGIAFHPDGTLYGVFVGMDLRTIDPASGSTTHVATVTGSSGLEGIAFAPDGTCYAVAPQPDPSSKFVYTLDISTGALSLIAMVPAFDLDALTYGPDGQLYSTFGTSGISDIYRIDPSSGSFTNLGSLGVVQAGGLEAVAPSSDCDGNGVGDECDIGGDASLDLNMNGILDSCECLAESFCLTSPNTVGPGAVMGVGGIPSISGNLFYLRASGLPPGQPGVFYFGDFSQAPPIPFGNGWRCVGGNTVRLNPPIFADANGNVIRALDFTVAPGNAFVPGDTRYFQFWYRDHPQVGATFNLTDALAVTFCP